MATIVLGVSLRHTGVCVWSLSVTNDKQTNKTPKFSVADRYQTLQFARIAYMHREIE